MPSLGGFHGDGHRTGGRKPPNLMARALSDEKLLIPNKDDNIVTD